MEGGVTKETTELRFGCFKTGSYCVAQASLRLKAFLPQPPKSWAYACAPQVYLWQTDTSLSSRICFHDFFYYYLCQIWATFMLNQMPRFLVLMNVMSQDPVSVEVLLFEEARDSLWIVFCRCSVVKLLSRSVWKYSSCHSRTGCCLSNPELIGCLETLQKQTALPVTCHHPKEFACCLDGLVSSFLNF